jgi:predicted TIM-barrel fold metal-dependent hydrolase
MIDGKLVIDAVAHAYDFTPGNRVDSCPPEDYDRFVRFVWQLFHAALESDEPGYLLSCEEYLAGFGADALASMFFEESDVDVIAYHGVEIRGFFKHGSSPYAIGEEMKRRWPDRVLLYAPVDPLAGPQELELMEQRAATGLVDGFKFYPSDGMIDPARHRTRTILYDDRELAWPYFEQARRLGIPRVAIHKAQPVGPGPTTSVEVDDVSVAAVAFPDMIFEVVHSGWAFLEDCALQLMLHPNIWANLEGVANFVVQRPRRFAEILGTLLQYGGADRLVFGTGGMQAHPQPIVQAIRDLEMPADLVEGMGLPSLTAEDKAKLLGGNMARLHGLDVPALTARLAADEWAERRRARLAEDAVAGGPQPWRFHRAAMAAAAAR